MTHKKELHKFAYEFSCDICGNKVMVETDSAEKFFTEYIEKHEKCKEGKDGIKE